MTLWRDRGAHRTAAERRAVGVLMVRQALADAAAADPALAVAGAAGPAGAADQRGLRGSDSNASPVAAAAPYQQQQQQQQQQRRRRQQQQQEQRSGKSSTSPARPFNGTLQSLRPADVNARASGGGGRAAPKPASKPTPKPAPKPAPKPGAQPAAHGELQRRQAASAADTAGAARERYERNTPRKQARDAQRAQLLALECAALVDEEGWTPPPSPRQPQGAMQGARERRRSAAPGAASGAAPGAVSSMRGRGALSRLRATLRRRSSSFAEPQAVSTVLV